MAKNNDFLNPQSMLTPAAAGTIVMGISNSLWVAFLLPPLYIALILSFLIVIPIITKFAASVIEKLFYLLFNGLFIFSVALGANTLGKTERTANGSAGRSYHYYSYKAPETDKESRKFFTDWFK